MSSLFRINVSLITYENYPFLKKNVGVDFDYRVCKCYDKMFDITNRQGEYQFELEYCCYVIRRCSHVMPELNARLL